MQKIIFDIGGFVIVRHNRLAGLHQFLFSGWWEADERGEGCVETAEIVEVRQVGERHRTERILQARRASLPRLFGGVAVWSAEMRKDVHDERGFASQ